MPGGGKKAVFPTLVLRDPGDSARATRAQRLRQQGSCEGAEAERHHDATRRAKAAAAQATKSESK